MKKLPSRRFVNEPPSDHVSAPTQNEKTIELLKRQLEQIDNLKNHPGGSYSDAFIEWRMTVDGILRRCFTDQSSEVRNFNNIAYSELTTYLGDDVVTDSEEAFCAGLDQAAGQLRVIINLLQTIGPPQSHPSDRMSASDRELNIHLSQDNHNSNYQQQSQHQEVTVSLSQSVDAALRYVRDNHTEEDTKRAEELLEPLKKKNATWAQIEKATQFFLGLGREAFSLVLKILLEHALSK